MLPEPVGKMIQKAMAGGYALGYFESWNLESLQGVIDAAEATRSPVLIGFNGGFLSNPSRLAAERLTWYAALAKAAAESSQVPCGMVFNECPRDEWVRSAVDAGFSQVMLDDPGAPAEELVRRVLEITQYAHSRSAVSEAEVGELPFGAEGSVVNGRGSMTDPDAAADFVERTGIDILGVSVGNVHMLVEGRRGLDVGRLSAIRKRVDTPFDLHGGTGIDADSLKAAIELGVAKVSFGTCMKQSCLSAFRTALSKAETQPNPHRILGMGYAEDALVAGRLAVRDAVLKRIHLLGCCGRA